MPKLYSNEHIPTQVKSLEEFVAFYNSSTVVSAESLDSFFSKLKDTFHSAKRSVTSSEAIVSNLLLTRFQTESAIKDINYIESVKKGINYIDFKETTVEVPENFKGKYIDYLKALLEIAETLNSTTTNTLNHLKLSISSFMNEYKEDKVFTLYGTSYFQETEKELKENKKLLKPFFPTDSRSVKAKVSSVLYTLKDVPELYNKAQELEKLITFEDIKKANRLASEASDLIDVLIENNKNSSILLKNNQTKKDLIFAIQIAAEQVEFQNYIYANMTFLYAAIQKLSEAILNHGTT